MFPLFRKRSTNLVQSQLDCFTKMNSGNFNDHQETLYHSHSTNPKMNQEAGGSGENGRQLRHELASQSLKPSRIRGSMFFLFTICASNDHKMEFFRTNLRN